MGTAFSADHPCPVAAILLHPKAGLVPGSAGPLQPLSAQLLALCMGADEIPTRTVALRLPLEVPRTLLHQKPEGSPKAWLLHIHACRCQVGPTGRNPASVYPVCLRAPDGFPQPWSWVRGTLPPRVELGWDPVTLEPAHVFISCLSLGKQWLPQMLVITSRCWHQPYLGRHWAGQRRFW